MAADQGHLARHALHPPVDRPDHQHVAARVAGAPDPDAVGIDLGERAGVADRVAVVAHLLPRGRSPAGARRRWRRSCGGRRPAPQAGGGERLREPVEVHLLHGREAMGHHDGRHRPRGPVGHVMPAPQHHARGVELDVMSHVSPSPGWTPPRPYGRGRYACTMFSPECHQPPRHGRLAVGDAAVVGRQALGDQHAQAGRLQPGCRGAQQPPVLEHAAREGDRPASGVLAAAAPARPRPPPPRGRRGSAPRRRPRGRPPPAPAAARGPPRAGRGRPSGRRRARRGRRRPPARSPPGPRR